VSSAWLREEEPDAAVAKILAAADKAFVEVGVADARMSTIADYAGCSRGTLYRYFKNRHELHIAYIEHTAHEMMLRVQRGLRGIEDPRERLVEMIVGSVREVRRNPGTAAWFEPGVSGMAARMGRSSEVVDRLTTTFVSELFADEGRDPESRMRARWLVRVIVSLLALPGDSEEEERALVERFVAPLLLPGAWLA
jgi:AcrR family transcriptional regulator